MSRTTAIASYLTDGAGHSAAVGGTTGSKYLQIPCAAIGLDEADADDFPEALNAILRTAAARYAALGADERPEHMRLSSSTYVGGSDAQRSYAATLDIAYSGESVVDEEE